MSDSQPMPYSFRMPDDLRAQVNALARANSRSLNAELVLLLHEAVTQRTSAAPTTSAPVVDVEALADALAPRLAAKLRESNGQ